jgi:hypothetical protein
MRQSLLPCPLLLVVAFLFQTGIALAQRPDNSQSSSPRTASPAGQIQAKPESAVPVTMNECEGINNCATWTFLGGQGNGQWPSGNVANLNVEHLDANNIVIHRADSTGASAGLTARYTGTRHGENIGGVHIFLAWTLGK